jgi:flagellar biosynthesis protein FlhF
MRVTTFRAKSIQEALALVRRELGPDAAILHTRAIHAGLTRWLGGGRQIEVLATRDEVDIPSRIPPAIDEAEDARQQFRNRLERSAAHGVEIDAPAPASERWRILREKFVQAGCDESAASRLVDEMRAAE